MSIRALTYARACLRRDECALHPTERLVFRTIADSCNVHTGQAFTGTWLAVECGVDMRTVRRALHRLRDDGYLRLEERDGLASIVTFPTAAYISTTPVIGVRGEQVRAPDMDDRGPLSPMTAIPGTYTSDDFKCSNNLEVIAREALCCDGTGYVYDESTRTVTPCPLHHPRRKAQ